MIGTSLANTARFKGEGVYRDFEANLMADVIVLDSVQPRLMGT